MPGDQRLDRRTRAAERHAGEVKLGIELEQFAGELRRGADAGIGHGIFRRIFLHELDQFLQRLRRQIRMDRNDVGRSRGERNRQEIGERIVGVLGVEARVHRVAVHERNMVLSRQTPDLIRLLV